MEFYLYPILIYVRGTLYIYIYIHYEPKVPSCQVYIYYKIYIIGFLLGVGSLEGIPVGFRG